MNIGQMRIDNTYSKNIPIRISDISKTDEQMVAGFGEDITFFDGYTFRSYYYRDIDPEPTDLFSLVHDSQVFVVTFYGDLEKRKYTHFVLLCDQLLIAISVTIKASWVLHLYDSIKFGNVVYTNPNFKSFLEKKWNYNFTGLNLNKHVLYTKEIDNVYKNIEGEYPQFLNHFVQPTSAGRDISMIDFISIVLPCVVVYAAVKIRTEQLNNHATIKHEQVTADKFALSDKSTSIETEKKTACPVCNSKFGLFEHVVIHILVHHVQVQTCSYCSNLRKASACAEHLVLRHSGKLIETILRETCDSRIHQYLDGCVFDSDNFEFYGCFSHQKLCSENTEYLLDVLPGLQHRVMFTKLSSISKTPLVAAVLGANDLYMSNFKVSDGSIFLLVSSDAGSLIIGMTEKTSIYGSVFLKSLQNKNIHVSNDYTDSGVTLHRIITSSELVSNCTKKFREKYSQDPANIQGKIIKELNLDTRGLTEAQVMSMAHRSIFLWYIETKVIPFRGMLSPTETEKVAMEMRLGVEYIDEIAKLRQPVSDTSAAKAEPSVVLPSSIKIQKLEVDEDIIDEFFWKKMRAIDVTLLSQRHVEKRGRLHLCYLCNSQTFIDSVEYFEHLWRCHRNVYDENDEYEL